VITLVLLAGVITVLVPSAVGSSAASSSRPVAFSCDDNGSLCTEPFDNPSYYPGQYIGHDEPSTLFYSNTAGAGNNQVYKLTIPRDSARLPKQDGTGGTWNFQLHPAFWFGMALCDNQSAPNPGGSTLAGPNVPCTADSDTNIFTGTTPGGTGYIGQHPGTAFMEMQFYPPGWSNAEQNVCDATRWCAAMTIDSLSQNSNTGRSLNSSCSNRLVGGTEYINFAYITKDGTPLGPPDPLNANGATFTPDLTKQLLMNAGDQLTVDLHDTAHGLQIVINDLTTGQSGSMTASATNGFGEIGFAPSPSTACSAIPSDFHPMYSTSSENTRVVWAAHSYNIAYSDEIGHWEYCNSVDFVNFPFPCTSGGATDPSGPDDDDAFCAPASSSFLIQVSGCTDTDSDFDGVSYQQVWPGIRFVPRDQTRVSQPIVFSSPQFNGGQNYDRVAFETDLPRIEDPAISPNNNCDRFVTGNGCINPPNGANFYPGFVARQQDGGCRWLEGGPGFTGNTNNFGGEVAQYGALLKLVYPGPAGPTSRFNDFRQVLSSNPCLP
jgi:hypothetical protein